MAYKKSLTKRTQKILDELDSTANIGILADVGDNETVLMQTFSNCTDLVLRKINHMGSTPLTLVYLKGMVDSKHLDDVLLKPLLDIEVGTESTSSLVQLMKDKLVPIIEVNIIETFADVNQHIVNGCAVLFIDSSSQALSMSAHGQLHRALDEPSTEALIRGPRLGFIEDIETNMSLIRLRLRTPFLKMEASTHGTISQTKVVITYIDNIASPEIVAEVKMRLTKKGMDSVLESGYIEEMIRDAPYSPFPVMKMTERPDSVAAALIEGRVAILTDGTPMALIVPMTFWQTFQTVEDYYMNFLFATLLRWVRYLFAFVVVLLPSVFVAITTFHPEMLPTSLALSIAASREVVPFPSLAETLLMEVIFEALREAGIRLPRPIGQTISIVGALVIGQAAVQAGIVSAPIVIIVALTGIGAFLIPDTNTAQGFRIVRFPFLMLGGSLGLYGIGIGLLALLIHLVNIRSFGTYYMSPIAPFNASGLWDVAVRAPWWIMHKRHLGRERSREKE